MEQHQSQHVTRPDVNYDEKELKQRQFAAELQAQIKEREAEKAREKIKLRGK